MGAKFPSPPPERENTNSIERYLSILGHRVRDRVTGQAGVATSVSFDLYGCVQVVVHPGLDKDGKARESAWFDIARLKIESPERVMEMPRFDAVQEQIAAGKKGPAEKPVP